MKRVKTPEDLKINEVYKLNGNPDFHILKDIIWSPAGNIYSFIFIDNKVRLNVHYTYSELFEEESNYIIEQFSSPKEKKLWQLKQIK